MNNDLSTQCGATVNYKVIIIIVVTVALFRNQVGGNYWCNITQELFSDCPKTVPFVNPSVGAVCLNVLVCLKIFIK